MKIGGSPEVLLQENRKTTRPPKVELSDSCFRLSCFGTFGFLHVGMYNTPMPKICIFPRVEGTGGVASFRLKFEAGLAARGIETTNDPDEPAEALLVLAGTRSLLPLRRARRRGTRLVQRLDGVNWVQRVRWTGVRYTLRAEYGNLVLTFIRKYLADRVVYQSQFIRKWWEAWYGAAKAPATVILNGVDLRTYSPEGAHERPADRVRMLLLEGNLKGGLDSGLFHAVALAEKLSAKRRVEVVVAGGVDEATQRKVQQVGKVPVNFLGTLPRERIPFLARSSHFLFSAEVNPPCPNSVIESLACGLPVAGFDSGSLRELVGADAGVIVPYGADPWKLDPPDIPALADAADALLSDQPRFRAAARARAESALGVDAMVDAYVKMLLEEENREQ
ncbi:MAG: glycosyltransferase [Anaerolineae bacterium CFX3]|nr:glycosyltransferase [Anaerolineae bacterium CFX3]